jgi:hypothetical protein
LYKEHTVAEILIKFGWWRTNTKGKEIDSWDDI